MQTVNQLISESKSTIEAKRSFWAGYGIVGFHRIEDSAGKRLIDGQTYSDPQQAEFLLSLKKDKGFTPRHEIELLYKGDVRDRLLAEYEVLEPGQVLCVFEDGYFNYSESIVA